MIRTLCLAALVFAAPALAGHKPDWSPECHQEENTFWFRPDQHRDTRRDEPEYAPRLPHARSVGAGRQKGRPPPYNADVEKQELSQWLSPSDDEVGYRGVCELHHSGPPCRGDNSPLPPWVPDSPDEDGWCHHVHTLKELDGRPNR